MHEIWIPFKSRIIGKSEFPFLIRLIYTEFNINSFSKKFILALVRRLIRFILFNFMYFFTNTLEASFEMFIFITNITNFSVICLGDVNYRKIYIFYKASCDMVVSVMWVLCGFPFKNFINVGGRLSSKNFADMLTCFLTSMACDNCFEQSEVAFSKKPFTKGVFCGTTYNHIFD